MGKYMSSSQRPSHAVIFGFHKVQWCQFSGSVVMIKILISNFFRTPYTKHYRNRLIFDRIVQNINVDVLGETVVIIHLYKKTPSHSLLHRSSAVTNLWLDYSLLVWLGGVMVRAMDSRLKRSRVQLPAVPHLCNNLSITGKFSH